MVAVLLGVFLGALDDTVVTTAMPTVVRALGGVDLYAWVFSAYLLTNAVTTPLWGKLADLRGARGLFLVGVSIFLTGSILSGSAGDMGQLVAYRLLQGIGAGAMTALPYAILGLVFPPEARARAIGTVSATWGVASVIGPLVGSAVVYWIGWRWVFYLNVPFGLIALWLGARYVPGVVARGRGRLDWAGAGLIAVGVAGLLVALQLAVPGRVVIGIAGAAALGAFVWWQRRAAEPLLAPFLLRGRLFLAANAIAFLGSFAALAVVYYLPLLSPPSLPPAVGAAILVFPGSVAWSSAGFQTDRFIRWLGVRGVMLGGTIAMTAGIAGFLLVLHAGAGVWTLALAAVPIGVGMGVQTPALLSAIQNGLRQQDIGMGTGAMQFLWQLGGVVGVAIVQVLFVGLLARAPAAARHALGALVAGSGAVMGSGAYRALVGALHQSLLLPLVVAALCLPLAWVLPREAG